MTTKAAAAASMLAPVVIDINDHVVGFYVGRGLSAPSPLAALGENWVDGGAWGLGAINYAVHVGDCALVYDTGTLPELGRWQRDYLAETLGIKHFTVVLSHWHLDHIAGNAAYADTTIVALDLTRDAMIANRAAIEAGTLWGPPAMAVVLPDVTFKDTLVVYVGSLRVEFHHFDIHSRDGNVMVIPSDETLYAGDTLEDTITYMVEPGDIPTHIAELERLRTLEIATIYPNHGDPGVIERGGYTKTLIDAMREYDVNMLALAHEPGYLTRPIEDFVPAGLANGAVSVFEPYRAVHANNLELVHDTWKNRAIPVVP